MIILLTKTFKYPSLLLYPCICTVMLTSLLSSTSACSMASKAVNAYCQCAAKVPIHNLVLSTTDLPMVADKFERKVHVIQSPNLQLVASEKQSVKSRTDRGKAHPSSQYTIPSFQKQHLFNWRPWSMMILL